MNELYYNTKIESANWLLINRKNNFKAVADKDHGLIEDPNAKSLVNDILILTYENL